MNIAQKTKILDIIDKNCHIREAYKNNGGHCIIGGMAEAIGIMDDKLADSRKSVWESGLAYYADCIAQKFGLSVPDLHLLQRINDTCLDIEGRRKELRNFIESKELNEIV